MSHGPSSNPPTSWRAWRVLPLPNHHATMFHPWAAGKAPATLAFSRCQLSNENQVRHESLQHTLVSLPFLSPTFQFWGKKSPSQKIVHQDPSRWLHFQPTWPLTSSRLGSVVWIFADESPVVCIRKLPTNGIPQKRSWRLKMAVENVILFEKCGDERIEDTGEWVSDKEQNKSIASTHSSPLDSSENFVIETPLSFLSVEWLFLFMKINYHSVYMLIDIHVIIYTCTLLFHVLWVLQKPSYTSKKQQTLFGLDHTTDTSELFTDFVAVL